MVPPSLLDTMARMLPKGKGSSYRLSSIALRGYNKAHKTKLRQETLTEEEGRDVATWLLNKIAKNYVSQHGFEEDWDSLPWVSLVLLGYWVGWAKRGVGTLLRNLKKKDIPFTLANALIESKTANVRTSVKGSKNYVLASNIAKAYLSKRGVKVPPPIREPEPILPPLVAIPKAKPKAKKAGFGLAAGIIAAGLAAALAFGKRKRR
jgi:hypothetical protein